jgi:hypothetical protein
MSESITASAPDALAPNAAADVTTSPSAGPRAASAAKPGASRVGSVAVRNAAPPTDPAADGAASRDVDWRAALPDDLKPVAAAKGWRTPAEALKSYVHLERLVGTDKIALPPKDAKGNRDWSKWEGWAAIGRPEAPDNYAFTPGNGRAFSDSDRAFQTHMAPLLHRAGLAQWQVDLLAGGLAEFGEQHRVHSEQSADHRRAAAEAELRREWGGAYERQMDLANRALRVFGGPEAVRALVQSGAGTQPAIVRAFARIGAALAEDGGLPGERHAGEGRGGALAPARARSEIQRLKSDPEFQAAFLDRMHPGHDAAMTRMLRLQAQVTDGEAA